MTLAMHGIVRDVEERMLKPPQPRQARSSKAEKVRLRLSGLSSPLEFIGCAELVHQFRLVLRGWTIETDDDFSSEPLIRIEKTRTGYAWRKAKLPMPYGWRTIPPRSVYTAVCHLHHKLVHWLVAEKPHIMCLHCGTIEFDDGLVVILGNFKAGKSTLTTELAATGLKMFGDDVLMIDGSTGISFGLLPRLRLPLPSAMSQCTRDFAAARLGLSNSGHQYVDMRTDELAAFGETAPIVGFIILDRTESGGATLAPASHGETMKALIARNILDVIPAKPTFDKLLALTQATRNYHLSYSTGSDAVDILTRVFNDQVRVARAG